MALENAQRGEKILEFVAGKEYKPMKRKEMATLFQVPGNEQAVFEALIDQLIGEGRLVETAKHKLVLPSVLSLVAGTFLGNARGFGFVATDTPGEKDIFIPSDRTEGAMHKDRVLCRVLSKGHGEKGPDGEIVKVLSRGREHVVGVYTAQKGYGLVEPDDQKVSHQVLIPLEESGGAVTGQKVVAEFTRYPEKGEAPRGRIVEILGHVDDPGVDILSIIRGFDLPVEFPEEVEQEILSAPIRVEEKDLRGREDFRDWQIVTIDGEDAKDLDDAISLEETPAGYRLGVHIADVSHYVRENSSLDQEARLRGTSVYLVDRVIPMLPHRLSNGICSLNQGEDRLTLSCIMDVDRSGKITDSRVVEGVICSTARMTYTAVKEILEDGKPETMEQYRDLVPLFRRMAVLRDILRKKRLARGAVDFDLPETKVKLDENGHPIDIFPYERNIATSIIEEFMLACNETVAETFFFRHVPFIYRSHEAPDTEKTERLLDFLRKFGYHIRYKGEVEPYQIAEIIGRIQGTPEEKMLSRVILRSMQQARYTSENLGHFGLAAKYYCHFTSPIRRYPDLTIHRVIKACLRGELPVEKANSWNRRFPDLADRCSDRERLADDAERATIEQKKVEYMTDKIGQVYDGTVSGVTSWGIFVELSNSVEGMVAVRELRDDRYLYDESNFRLVGERSKKVYRLGDPVTIQVVRADTTLRVIDFQFV